MAQPRNLTTCQQKNFNLRYKYHYNWNARRRKERRESRRNIGRMGDMFPKLVTDIKMQMQKVQTAQRVRTRKRKKNPHTQSYHIQTADNERQRDSSRSQRGYQSCSIERVPRRKSCFLSTHVRLIGWVPINQTDNKQVNKRKNDFINMCIEHVPMGAQ